MSLHRQLHNAYSHVLAGTRFWEFFAEITEPYLGDIGIKTWKGERREEGRKGGRREGGGREEGGREGGGREEGGREEGREVVPAHIYSWTIDCTHGRVGTVLGVFWNKFGLPGNQNMEGRREGGRKGEGREVIPVHVVGQLTVHSRVCAGGCFWEFFGTHLGYQKTKT